MNNGVDMGTLIAMHKALGGGSGGGSSGGGVLVVNEDENSTLDKTYAEIKSASNDSVVLLHSGDDILYLTAVGRNPITGVYGVAFFGNNALNQYEADAEDGYPVIVS